LRFVIDGVRHEGQIDYEDAKEAKAANQIQKAKPGCSSYLG
jgi:hypothetical protein